MNAENKKKIVISVEGGVVQSIDGIPEDVVVVVRDFDVDGVDEADLTKDGRGDACVESAWEKEDQPET